MAGFAETLRKLREETGHPSARAFYRGRGGQSFFGCTYKAYLNVESGRSLPQARLAMRIAVALGAAGEPERARAFVASYLRSLVAGEELAGFLLRALSGSGAPAQASLFRKASEKSFSEQVVPLSREQCEAQLKSGEHYWAFTVLQDDRGSWTPAALARLSGFKESRLESALEDLVRAGLLAREKGGAFRCPLAGKVFVYPRDRFYVPRYLPAMKSHWESMASRRGKVVLHRHLFTRASEAELRNYFPYLAQSVNAAHIYSTKEKGPDTAFFAVSATVRKVRPF